MVGRITVCIGQVNARLRAEGCTVCAATASTMSRRMSSRHDYLVTREFRPLNFVWPFSSSFLSFRARWICCFLACRTYTGPHQGTGWARDNRSKCLRNDNDAAEQPRRCTDCTAARARPRQPGHVHCCRGDGGPVAATTPGGRQHDARASSQGTRSIHHVQSGVQYMLYNVCVVCERARTRAHSKRMYVCVYCTVL